MIEIRAVGPADAEQLYALRSEALRAAPFSFLSSPDDDILATVAVTRERLSKAGDSIVFGAFDPRLAGMLGLYREGHLKAAHKVGLWGFYVRPEARCQGLGERLVAAALDHARGLDGVTSVHLGVSETAGDAKRLYVGAGFKVWGLEPEALCHDGRSVGEYHMWLSLSPDQAGPHG